MTRPRHRLTRSTPTRHRASRLLRNTPSRRGPYSLIYGLAALLALGLAGVVGTGITAQAQVQPAAVVTADASARRQCFANPTERLIERPSGRVRNANGTRNEEGN